MLRHGRVSPDHPPRGDPLERALLQRRRRAAEPLWRDALGEQLRRRRHERRDTLDDPATRAGISPQYLSEIERGRKEPSSEMIAAVAGALDVTLLDLTLAVAESIHRLQERSLAQRRVGGTGVVDG